MPGQPTWQPEYRHDQSDFELASGLIQSPAPAAAVVALGAVVGGVSAAVATGYDGRALGDRTQEEERYREARWFGLTVCFTPQAPLCSRHSHFFTHKRILYACRVELSGRSWRARRCVDTITEKYLVALMHSHCIILALLPRPRRSPDYSLTNPNLVAQRAGRVQLEQRVCRAIYQSSIDKCHRKHHLYVSEESLNVFSLARSLSLSRSPPPVCVSVSIAYDSHKIYTKHRCGVMMPPIQALVLTGEPLLDELY